MSSGLRPGHDWVPNIAWPAVGRAVGSEQRYPQLSLWSNHNNPLSLYPTDVCRLCPNEQESMGAYLPWQLCFGVSKSCADIHRWGGLAHQAALAWLLFMSWSGLIYLQKLFIDFLWRRLSGGIRMRCVHHLLLQAVIISMVTSEQNTFITLCRPVGHLSHTLFILNFMIPRRLSKSGHISQISRLGKFILLSACHR